MTTITEHEGKKYLRVIKSAIREEGFINVDVYAVLVAFKVICPARQHAIKKLLCAGERNKGNALNDLMDASAAINRAIELERDKEIE